MRLLESSESVAVAEDCLSKLMSVTPCLFKQCKSHVYRAVSEFPNKKSSELPKPMRSFPSQFESLFTSIAKEMTECDSISHVIARLSVVICILESKQLPCGTYNGRSAVLSGPPITLTQSYAMTMDKAIKEQAEAMQIECEEEFSELMTKEFVDESNNKFGGDVVARRVVDRFMGRDKRYASVKFAVPYLKHKSKNKKNGIIRLSYIHSPYDKDDDGMEVIKPKVLGGVSVKVMLPHKSGYLTNPLYCPEAADYLMKYWLNRIGLWNQPVLNLFNQVRNCNAYSCNNSLEGYIKNEKHGSQSRSEDVKDLPSLIYRRWLDSIGTGKLLCDQIENASYTIERRMNRNKNKKKRDRLSEKAEEDELALGMRWKKTPSTIKAKLKEEREKMMRALEIGKSLGDFDYSMKKLTTVCHIINEHALSIESSFMKIDSFRAWMNGKRKAALKPQWSKVISSFHKKYFE